MLQPLSSASCALQAALGLQRKGWESKRGQHNCSLMPMPVSCATTLSPLSFDTMRTEPPASRTMADVLKLSIRCMNAAADAAAGEGCDVADDDAEAAPPLLKCRCGNWAAAPLPLLGRLCFLLEFEPSPVSFRLGIEGGAIERGELFEKVCFLEYKVVINRLMLLPRPFL